MADLQIPPQPGEAVLSCGHHVSYSPVMERPDAPDNATYWLELVPMVQAGPVSSRWLVICEACVRSAGGLPLDATRAVRQVRTHWCMPDPERSPLDNLHAVAPAGPAAMRRYLDSLDDGQLLALAAQRAIAGNDG